jgi:hypothetical protein
MSDGFKRHVPKQARPAPRARPKKAAVPKAGDKAEKPAAKAEAEEPKEIGGPGGPEPTRYGDWEINGRCVDF